MTSLYHPLCLVCTHYDRAGTDATCAAYPDGIPEPILLSLDDHQHPLPNDHGIQFEPADAAGAAYAAAWTARRNAGGGTR